MNEGQSPARRTLVRGLVVLLDVAALAMIAAGLEVLRDGPYRFALFGLRVSVPTFWRPWVNAAVILAVRTFIDPLLPSIGRRLRAVWRFLVFLVRRVGGIGPAFMRLPLGEAALFGGDQPRSLRRRAIEAAVVTTAFTLLAIAFTWPQVRHMDSVPDMGDPLFSIWRISWVNHQFWRHPAALFDANIFHSERLTLTYSDPVIVPALMSAPLFWLGLHQLHIYNVLFLSSFVLSGVCTFQLVQALTGRRDAAAIAGIVFALHPYRFEHYSHLELQMTMWMPVALLAVHRVFANGRVRHGVVAGVAFAAQMLSSLYYGLYFAVYLVVVGGALWLGRRRPMRPLATLMGGAMLAGVLVAPVASRYLANRSMMGDRDPATVGFYSANFEDYLKPHFRSYVYEPWSYGGMAERQLFPHIAPVLLAATALVPPVTVAEVGYGVALVVSIEASRGTNGYLFPLLRAYVPGYAGLRVPARFSILAGLSIAVLAGCGVAKLLRRWPSTTRWLPLALAVPVLFEALPNITLEPVWTAPPAIYAPLASEPDAVVAELPVPSRTQLPWSDTRYEYFSTFHWYRMVNGNSGFAPPSYLELLEREVDFPDDAAIAYLKSRGVTHIAWHGSFTNPGRHEDTVAMLAARPDVELLSKAPWEGSESRLYRLK